MDTWRLYAADYEVSEKEDSFIVDWEPSDMKNNPMSWSIKKRFCCTIILTLVSFIVTMASSVGSGTYDAVCKEFGVSKEVSEMTTSLFLVGFAMGAPVLAPMCEEFGRLPVYIGSMLLFSCFQIGAATSQNMASLAICRFFAGFFGTSPLSNAGGSIADMWESDKRTLTFSFFGVSGFLGPSLGPVIGSYLTKSYLGWRWTNYLAAIIGYGITVIVFFFMPETFSPIIMDLKAAAIRKKTGCKDYISLHEIQREGRSPFSLRIFFRPFVFAVTEPIVTCFTLCISISYIVLFTDFEAFTYIFGTWDFDFAKSTLPFIAVSLGIVATLLIVTPISYHFFMKEGKKHGSIDKISPEIRLVPLMVCAWFIPISLFWVAWTTYESISPWPAIVSTFFFGLGMMQVFLTTYSYVIDSYGVNSASALSTLTLVRYNISAGMVHVADPMYRNLGVHWAASLLGFISLIICVMPFIFYFYGPKIRSYSKFTTASKVKPQEEKEEEEEEEEAGITVP
ncbi:uncharacterized protein PRCAT00002170001 [Priceomyces carsonii]|uniref:uncharacterized protein n=1 Tax=Priceomyces carsonii TaxID=28549 RepID=UPI002EDAC399|nr:unnamed protein product [Priceomyces carsonii]